MTYILVALSLGLGFKSALLFTHENNNSFEKMVNYVLLKSREIHYLKYIKLC